MTWLATQDVLDWLGLDQSGPVMDACVAATEAHIPTWRDDIPDWGIVHHAHPDVYLAAVQFAALTYQENVTPEGFAGFDDAGGVLLPSNAKVIQIRRLARANRPKVG